MDKGPRTMAFVLTSDDDESRPDWFFVGHNGECVCPEGEELRKFMTFDHMLSQYHMDLDDYQTPPMGIFPPWI